MSGQRQSTEYPLYAAFLLIVMFFVLLGGHLVKTVRDLFIGGTETTATTIRWTLLYFLHNPEVQEKCFREIQEHIGESRKPSMKDKTNLPYVEATISEVHRCSTIAPLAVPHGVLHNVQFRGYTFPKGVTVLPNLDSVLHDPTVWGDPQNFRPERFLDDQGKYLKRDEFIPFSMGNYAVTFHTNHAVTFLHITGRQISKVKLISSCLNWQLTRI